MRRGGGEEKGFGVILFSASPPGESFCQTLVQSVLPGDDDAAGVGKRLFYRVSILVRVWSPPRSFTLKTQEDESDPEHVSEPSSPRVTFSDG